MSSNSRATIAELVDRFISDGKVILTHGFSRVVQTVLIHAAQAGKNFSVLVTEARPNCEGYHAAAELLKAGIPVTLILDSAVAYSMDQADLVLIGAEGVAESGGIINKIGTYQMCMCATMMKKPVYVAAESYKFARLFPLNQNDLPETKAQQPNFRPAILQSAHTLHHHSSIASPVPATPIGREATASYASASATSTQASAPPALVSASAELLFSAHTSKQYAEKLTLQNPSCDYTPPEFLTLLFTDIGILTPSAVSDELIKLYY
jgi:translation initiation factor eIF-2B subunit alpha